MIKLNRKRKNTLLVFGLLLGFIFLSLTPLVPNAEVETRLMVNTIGIDMDERGMTVTAETINGGENEVVYGRGSMLADTLQDMNERYGRRVELGHCGLVALGKDMKRSDAVCVFMNLLSDGLLNTGCSVISADTSAREFIADSALLTKSTGNGASGFVTFSDSQTSVTVPSVLETMQALKSKSGVAVMPVLGFAKKEEKSGQSGNNLGDTEQSSSQNNSAHGETEIIPPDNAKIFSREAYLLGKERTKGLKWLLPRSVGGIAEAPLEYNGKTFILRSAIEKKDITISARFEDVPVIDVKIDARLHFAQRYAILAEVEKGASLSHMHDLMAQAYVDVITQETRVLAELSRTDDFLGYATRLYRADPKRYKEWDGDLSTARINYDVHATVL